MTQTQRAPEGALLFSSVVSNVEGTDQLLKALDQR